MRRVADVVASWLVDAGIRDVFLLPGGGAMYLNDGIACEPRLDPVPCHHEQSCGIAAEAYGRVGGPRFGVAIVTTGPGATNVLTPVAGAWIESLPLMIISGQVKRADALNGRPLRQSGVQEVEALDMVRGVTKFASRVNEPTAIVAMAVTPSVPSPRARPPRTDAIAPSAAPTPARSTLVSGSVIA
ncbi:MAG: thiamine pyrophosphate-binding protein, partial [Betaproteobacteria bacterium]|nr:thiamine pyrophosphate-binding protein [Betaproteobacteria bacterium]